MERKDDPFNQTEFNKVILENVLKTQLAMARVLGASTLAPYVADKPKLNNYQQIISEIKESVNDELAKFFIDIDSDSNSEWDINNNWITSFHFMLWGNNVLFLLVKAFNYFNC